MDQVIGTSIKLSKMKTDLLGSRSIIVLQLGVTCPMLNVGNSHNFELQIEEIINISLCR